MCEEIIDIAIHFTNSTGPYHSVRRDVMRLSKKLPVLLWLKMTWTVPFWCVHILLLRR